MVPSSFRALRWLGPLTDAAVGLSLAALTATVTASIERSAVFCTGLPTLVIGTAWARFLRRPAGASGGAPEPSFWWSILFAVANGALSSALVFGDLPERFEVGAFLVGLVAGVTVGAMVWVPALVLTLVLYGLPIAWSRWSARRGLAGRERGELVVGAVSALLAAVALVLVRGMPESPWPAHQQGRWFAQALALAAIAGGGLASAIAAVRARRRRSFVAAVEAGTVERFRIDPTDEGKTLVRIAVAGATYRAVDLEEEVAALDRDGLVTRVAGS